jgi:squalene-hopene/tetraprenyl-beta-curcumene cyclase
MSLIASGGMADPVTDEGLEFLIRSVRLDGSWPIDTNLATWVTTLSLNALAAGGRLPDRLSPDERRRVRAWLLAQQYRVRHPYTGAAPGGWAWTDLPGGVPDADDTAGALIALHHLGELDAKALDAAQAGVRWLLDLQNRDGSIPTFCRGWGHLPFDRSSPELTVHALAAWEAWRDLLPARLSGEVGRAMERGLRSLQSQQRPDGSWIPLWFGNQAAPDEENPVYGTSRVVSALCRSKCGERQAAREMASRGVAWLLAAQGPEGGWGGAPGLAPSIEEAGHALQALSAAYEVENLPALGEAIGSGAAWLIRMTGSGNQFQATPVGLYFAKLWYSEQLYPLIATAGALGLVSRVWDLLPSFVEDLQ